MNRYTVVTTRGGFKVYAVSPLAARRQMERQGHVVLDVRPRDYTPPTPPDRTP